MKTPSVPTILRMINWWILIPLIFLSDLTVNIGESVIRGGFSLIVIGLLFQLVRIIRILRRLPVETGESDVVSFFRADAAHYYFSITDVVAGIEELSAHKKKIGEQVGDGDAEEAV